MISDIASCLSYISNDYLLMLIAVLFYVFSKRSEHAHLVILLLFAMIYKAFLKELLKIPAPMTSPTKYGFPSGHINFATVFFGWCMLTYRRKLVYWLCPIALTLASISTIYLGYHDISDVVLTPLLPICYLSIYYLFMLTLKLNNFVIIFVITSTLCLLFSGYFLDKIPIDVIIGSYGILGFGIGLFMLQRKCKMLLLMTGILLVFSAYAESLHKFIQNDLWLIVFGALPIIAQIRNFVSKKLRE